MGKIKLYLKYMTRNKIVVALTMGILGYVLYNIVNAIMNNSNGKVAQIGNYSIQLANITNAAYIYIALFFMLAVYFSYNIINSQLDELHYQLYKKSKNIHLLSLIVVNVICVLIFTIIHLIIASPRFNMDATFAVYIIKRYVLCYFMPALFMTILGCSVGRIKNIMLLWVVCIITLLVCSPLAIGLYDGYTNPNTLLRTICYNFDIIQNNLSGSPGFDTDATYLYKWVKIIGLIAIVCALYTTICKWKKTKFINIALITVFCFCEAYYFIPDSKTLDLENWCSNNDYYINNIGGVKELEAEFKITNYELAMTFGKTLAVKAIITIDNSTQEELNFTLYHTFDIKNITNLNGEKVEYIRNGDYFTIKNNEHIDSFVITYDGKTEFYISNDKYIYLPQNYAYYPLSGFKDIGKNSKYLQANNDYTSEFDISINVNNIYTNLTKASNGHYIGNTTGPLFVKGDLKEVSIRNYNFVIPRYMPDATLLDDKSLEKLSDYFDELEKMSNYNFHGKNIYILYYCGGVVCADWYNQDYIDLPSAKIDSIERMLTSG